MQAIEKDIVTVKLFRGKVEVRVHRKYVTLDCAMDDLDVGVRVKVPQKFDILRNEVSD